MEGLSLIGGLLFTGVCSGMLTLLVASGFTIIFGLMDIMHLAHGSVFMWGAYIGLTAYRVSNNFYIGFLAAMAGTALLGAILERGFLRPLVSQPMRQMLIGLGLILVLDELVKLIWGTELIYVPKPVYLEQWVSIGGVSLSTYRFFVIGVGVIVILLVHLLLSRTRVGLIIRAALQNREMVECLGINSRKIFTAVFIVGSILAGIGGAVTGPFLGASPEMGLNILIGVIIVVIIGGMGSFWGTVLASLIIGITQSLVAFFYPYAAVAVSIGLMALILLVRPQGLLGKAVA